MASYTEIPIAETSPDFTLSVPLSGAVYSLRFQWNMRSGWYMSLSDSTSTRILSARYLTPNWPLLRQCVDARRPPGELWLIDLSSPVDYPRRNDLGSRHRLVYVD
jgi:hypothetical protein